MIIGESEQGAVVEASAREGSRRRSRRSLETETATNTSPTVAKHLPLDNASLQELLDQLMHHEDAWPFLRPVTKADVSAFIFTLIIRICRYCFLGLIT